MSHNKEKTKEEIIEESPAVTEKDITPRDLMKFAKAILIVIALLFAMGAVSELIHPNGGVFEACKTILPPIATLVIGFYFGKSN